MSARTMTKKPRREILIFRGTRYELEELEAGEFTEIEERATIKEFDPATGEPKERFDGRMQENLLLGAMLVVGMPAGGPKKIPQRELVNIRRKLNEMCFGELKNEFEPPSTNGTGEAKTEGEDEGKGEG
jgi:hypothetical protein